MGQLDGKVAVVTAASRGIGLAITKKYVAEGAIVYMAVRDSEKNRNLTDEMHQENDHYRRVIYDAMDMSTYEKMIKDVVDDAGHIDILVNNFGTTNIQKDLTEPANATFSIIREKQAPELYKLIGIFTYQGENDLFYLKIDPPSDITQISQFDLQTDFDNDKFDYLSDYFSASAVIPQIQSKFIDDLLKDINFSNLYRLQALNKNSSSDTKLPSQFVDYYEFVKDRQFYLGQLQQKNQLEKEVHSSQTNNLEEKEFIK